VEPAMQVSRVVHRLFATLIVVGSLNLFLHQVPAQEPDSDGDRPAALTPEMRDELDELLTLTVQQQIQRARELIKEHPDTELARVLQRLLAEHAAFNQVKLEEQRLREARSEWARAYWRDRCCPLPPWNPPVGRIINETNGPVLYEQRLDGIHRSRWAGPYFMTAGQDHSSPHPYLVRYLVAGDLRVRLVVPGDNYAFRGSAEDGTLDLVPTGSPLTTASEVLPVPPPAAEPSDLTPDADEPADVPPTTDSYDPAPSLNGPTIPEPMIVP
jgi:hypothetical protein